MSRHSKSNQSVKELDQSVREASPRGGGYLLVSPDLVAFQSETLMTKSSKSSCVCKGFESDSEADWEVADEDKAPSIISTLGVPDFNVIGNVITVVMLLASGNRPKDFQLQCATDYLECIKDIDGNTPPNIQGLLNHIQMVIDGDEGDVVCGQTGQDEEGEEDAEGEEEEEEEEEGGEA